MSLPYDLLLELAEAHKPKLAIKAKSIWVAVLLHTKLDVEDINDEKDFMWVKCHDRITIKTIKHNYFMRHPLNEFKIKHKNGYPRMQNTVGLLKSRDKSKTNVLVLRALEPEDAEHEDQIWKDIVLTRSIREKAVTNNAQTPIVIDGDGDEDDIVITKTNRLTNGGKAKKSAKVNNRGHESSPEVLSSSSGLEAVKMEHEEQRRNGRGHESSPEILSSSSGLEAIKLEREQQRRQISKASSEIDDHDNGDEDHAMNGDDERSRSVSYSASEKPQTPSPELTANREFKSPTPAGTSSPHTYHPPQHSPITPSPHRQDYHTPNEYRHAAYDTTPYNDLSSSQLLSEQSAASGNAYTPPTFASLLNYQRSGSASPIPQYTNAHFDDFMVTDHNAYAPMTGLQRRILELPDPYRALFTDTDFHHCEVSSCHKPMYLKPWTEFGPRYGALCTRCSLIRMERFPLNLSDKREAIASELHQKQELARQGLLQDMDLDAPFNNDPFFVPANYQDRHTSFVFPTPSRPANINGIGQYAHTNANHSEEVDANDNRRSLTPFPTASEMNLNATSSDDDGRASTELSDATDDEEATEEDGEADENEQIDEEAEAEAEMRRYVEEREESDEDYEGIEEEEDE